MALQYVCDRCGEVRSIVLTAASFSSNNMTAIALPAKWTKAVQRDLCPKCTAEFLEWMEE